jgi:hypothetical protein
MVSSRGDATARSKNVENNPKHSGRLKRTWRCDVAHIDEPENTATICFANAASLKVENTVRFLTSIIMAALAAASFTPSLAQTAPPAPAASAQPAIPARLPKTEGLLVWFGDTADKIKAAYHTDEQVQPNPGERYPAYLWLKTEGVFCFLDEEGKVRLIRLDKPSAGKINGVSVGDSLAQLFGQLGPINRYYRSKSPNPAFPDTYAYDLGDVTVHFSVRASEKIVETIWLMSEKPAWDDAKAEDNTDVSIDRRTRHHTMTPPKAPANPSGPQGPIFRRWAD